MLILKTKDGIDTKTLYSVLKELHSILKMRHFGAKTFIPAFRRMVTYLTD
ncbi:MAG: hypothetical protein LBU34_12755 [Planctomycetaceae bacterium]|nr:hypothetical protein [Planctomycetaceae bacterium]